MSYNPVDNSNYTFNTSFNMPRGFTCVSNGYLSDMSGNRNSPISDASFNMPRGFTCVSNGYLSDMSGNRNSSISDASFNMPRGFTCASNSYYLSDMSGNRNLNDQHITINNNSNGVIHNIINNYNLPYAV